MDTITFIVSLVLYRRRSPPTSSSSSASSSFPLCRYWCTIFSCPVVLSSLRCSSHYHRRTIGCWCCRLYVFGLVIFTHLNFQVVAHCDISQSSIVQPIYILLADTVTIPCYDTICGVLRQRPFPLYSLLASLSLLLLVYERALTPRFPLIEVFLRPPFIYP